MPNSIHSLSLRQKDDTDTYSLFLFSPFSQVHTPPLSFSPQSLSLQFHSHGIQTAAAAASSRIDKTMAIARTSRRYPMPLEFYMRRGEGMVFTYIESCLEIIFTPFGYATNVSLAISQARKNPFVTRPNAFRLLQNYFQVSRYYLRNSWLLISMAERASIICCWNTAVSNIRIYETFDFCD